MTEVSCGLWNDLGGRYLVGPCGCACVEVSPEWPFGERSGIKPVCQRFCGMRREWSDTAQTAPMTVYCADSVEEAVALSLMGD